MDSGIVRSHVLPLPLPSRPNQLCVVSSDSNEQAAREVLTRAATKPTVKNFRAPMMMTPHAHPKYHIPIRGITTSLPIHLLTSQTPYQ